MAGPQISIMEGIKLERGTKRQIWIAGTNSPLDS